MGTTVYEYFGRLSVWVTRTHLDEWAAIGSYCIGCSAEYGPVPKRLRCRLWPRAKKVAVPIMAPCQKGWACYRQIGEQSA